MVKLAENSPHNKKMLEKLYKIREEFDKEKKVFNYPNTDIKIFEAIRIASKDKTLKGKSLEKGFSAIGLVITNKEADTSNTMDEWYGYLIIKSDYFRELTWMMNKILRLFNDYFRGMEAREYLYDHIGGCMKKSLAKNPINIVFKDVLDEADRLIDEEIKFYQQINS